MKNFIITFGLGFLIFFIAWNGGYLFGTVKAESKIEAPVPKQEVVAGSSAAFYDKYMLQNCLLKVQRLEAE